MVLQAVEAAEIIERAFFANQVDTFVGGYWYDIQVELGLEASRLRLISAC